MLIVPAGSMAGPVAISLGENMDFKVLLDPNGIGNLLVGAQLFMRFDPTVVEVVSVAHDSSTLSFSVEPLVDNGAGTVQFAAFTTERLAQDQAPFTFATITFKAKAPSEGRTLVFEYARDGSKSSVSDTLGQELLGVTQDHLQEDGPIDHISPQDHHHQPDRSGEDGRSLRLSPSAGATAG